MHFAACCSAPCAPGGSPSASRVACLSWRLLASPLIPRQFFPPSDRPELLVDLSLPQNASIFATETSPAFRRVLKDDPDVASWSTYVGRGAIRFYLPLDVQLPNDFFAQAVVIAKDVAARDRLQARAGKVARRRIPQRGSRVSPLELGPPVGWPVQYRVSGPDVGRSATSRCASPSTVAGDPDARHVNFDWIEPARHGPDPHRPGSGAPAGPQLAGAGRRAQLRVTGTTVTQLRDGYLSGRRGARATDEQRVSLATLRTSRFRCPTDAPCRSASSPPSSSTRNTR